MNIHQHQVYSITLDGLSSREEFFTSVFHLDSSFDHLQSLELCDLNLPILVQLSSLPRLSSLIICVDDIPLNLADIYRLVFNLPMLKSYTFFTSELDLPISLSMANDQQVTQIENLNIDHCCDYHELLTILSYTPQISRLRFSDHSGAGIQSYTFLSKFHWSI